MPRALVTRAASDAGDLAAALRAVGLVPVCVALVDRRLHPAAVAAALRGPAPDVLLLTSPAVVPLVAAAWPPGWRPGRVAAVGPVTAEAARAAGLPVDVVPTTSDGAHLIAALGALSDARVLYPRAAEATPATHAALRAAGARVTDVIAYDNVLPPGAGPQLARAWPVDVVTLASASAAHRLAHLLAAHALSPAPVVALGASTAEAARSAGLTVAGVAAAPTMTALARAAADAVRPSGTA